MKNTFNFSSSTIGALWMLLAACLLSTISALVRHIAADLHPFQIAFFRNVGQFAFMLPWVAFMGIAVLKTNRILAHVRRSIFGLFAMLVWFSVLSMMPLAEATAITFSAPLFTTAGAALFLGESVGRRRWGSTVVGFIGVMIIIRPGFVDVGQAQMLALTAAVLIAAAMLSNKSLAKTEKPNAMVVWMGLLMSIFSFPPALMVWQTPEPQLWWWLVGLGLVATLAHLCLNRAFASADASFIAPFGFSQIPFVAVIAFVTFGEVPDIWTWTGATIIFVSGMYTAHREAKIARMVSAPPGAAIVAVGRENA